MALPSVALGRHTHVPHAHGLLSIRKRARERRRADELLLGGADPDGSALLSARAAELTSEHDRGVLARSLERTVRELEGHVLPSAVPLDRAGGRAHLELVRALAMRLRAPEPVTPRGVLLVQELLTDGYGSPLYNHDRAADLAPALERCLTALEPRDRVAD